MSKTLLEIAKGVRCNKENLNITDEQVELAFAWIKGEVGLKQVNVALGNKGNSGNALYKMATVLREAYKRGKLIINEE